MLHSALESAGLLFEKVPKYRSLLVESITRDESYEGLVDFFSSIVELTNIRGSHKVRMGFDDRQNITVANIFSSTETILDKVTYSLEPADKERFRVFVYPFLQGLGIDIARAYSNIQDGTDEKSIEIEFFTNHLVDVKKNLDFKLESSGTKMLINLLYDIFYAWRKGAVLIVDELDSILHPMLVPAVNILAAINNVQLLYTTHNIYNLKFLYSDEIILVDKNDNHETTVSYATEFPGYKNFAQLYEDNKLGGLPSLGELDFNMDVEYGL